MQPLLTKSLNSLPTFDCRVEVIDARNSTKVPAYSKDAPNHNQFKDIPCSGMYPAMDGGSLGWAWEMQGSVTAALKVAILRAVASGKETRALADYRKAIDIALQN